MGEPKRLIKVPGHATVVELLGEALCLNFANTVEPRRGNEQRDYLTSYGDFVGWSVHAGAITESRAQKLLNKAGKHPSRTQRTLDQAIFLRELIYQIFFAIATGQEVSPKRLGELHQAYLEALSQSTLIATGDGFSTVWVESPTQLTQPLWPILQSVLDLLLNGKKQRIKVCQDGEDGCGWLFYDTTKNGSRRWCSMQGCGAEAKERRRGKRTSSGGAGSRSPA